MGLGIILVIVPVLFLFGALPRWPHSDLGLLPEPEDQAWS
jgi:hypothetical protein